MNWITVLSQSTTASRKTGRALTLTRYLARLEPTLVFSTRSAPSCSTGSPAARHSATPSSNLVARYPHSHDLLARDGCVLSDGCVLTQTLRTEDIMSAAVNTQELEAKVKDMYRQVAENPHGEFHFEMGRVMAERLGNSPADLDRTPSEAIDSFAGVGYFFHLAELKPGEAVVDLGSGSGMDSFVAALKVGPTGLRLVKFQDNPEYQFISDNAKGAARKFGVKSASILAVKD